MHLEELAHEFDGRDITLGLHPRLTVLAGLDAPGRQEWIERWLEMEWVALLDLPSAVARAVMVVEAPASGETAGTNAADEELAQARSELVRLEAEGEEAGAEQEAADRRWRHAVAALEVARGAFGSRSRLERPAVERGLLLPTQPPPGLEDLHRTYLDAVRRRADAQAHLDEVASVLAPPSAPWVADLAQLDLAELWRRAEHLQAAKGRAAEIALALGGSDSGDIVTRIEVAHAEAEEAEQRLGRAGFGNRAARRVLAAARQAEQEILARAGFDGWLGFQLQRVGVETEPAAHEHLQAAEVEGHRAASAWSELAGPVDVESALAARAEVEAYAARLTDTRTRAVQEARTALEEADAAHQAARTALLEVCGPLAEAERALEEFADVAATAIHARLQRALEEAEEAEEAASRELDGGLARAARLAGGDDALRHWLTVLEASIRPLPDEDPAMALIGRFALVRETGRQAEALPLVINDALAGYPRAERCSLLELLARLGEGTQVIYLTDDPETVQWAERRSRLGDLAVILPDSQPDPSPSLPARLDEAEDPPVPGRCERHWDQPALAPCQDCGTRTCSLCLVRAAGADLCIGCAFVRAGIRRRARGRAARGTKASKKVGERPSPARS
jgi:hypothetical protein